MMDKEMGAAISVASREKEVEHGLHRLPAGLVLGETAQAVGYHEVWLHRLYTWWVIEELNL
jgi:hypothetical protein